MLHIRPWVARVAEIVRRGKEAYLADDLLQEARDSLMMKLGEAANRLSRLGVLAPDGVEWELAVANRSFITRWRSVLVPERLQATSRDSNRAAFTPRKPQHKSSLQLTPEQEVRAPQHRHVARSRRSAHECSKCSKRWAKSRPLAPDAQRPAVQIRPRISGCKRQL